MTLDLINQEWLHHSAFSCLMLCFETFLSCFWQLFSIDKIFLFSYFDVFTSRGTLLSFHVIFLAVHLFTFVLFSKRQISAELVLNFSLCWCQSQGLFFFSFLFFLHAHNLIDGVFKNSALALCSRQSATVYVAIFISVCKFLGSIYSVSWKQKLTVEHQWLCMDSAPQLAFGCYLKMCNFTSYRNRPLTLTSFHDYILTGTSLCMSECVLSGWSSHSIISSLYRGYKKSAHLRYNMRFLRLTFSPLAL